MIFLAQMGDNLLAQILTKIIVIFAFHILEQHLVVRKHLLHIVKLRRLRDRPVNGLKDIDRTYLGKFF